MEDGSESRGRCNTVGNNQGKSHQLINHEVRMEQEKLDILGGAFSHEGPEELEKKERQQEQDEQQLTS